MSQGTLNHYRYTLPPALESEVRSALQAWMAAGFTVRLWARDPTVWTGSDEGSWLGWLNTPAEELAGSARLTGFAEQIGAGDFADTVVLGMGGSSLCPTVLTKSYPHPAGFPRLHVLDSTDPDQIRAMEASLDLARTLFMVSSKSGTTLEPNIFYRYFRDRVDQISGRERAGSQFVAITDPGSKLEQLARADGFRQIFHGTPSIGGRYSALSDFGLVPAAAMGIDVPAFLAAAVEMEKACGPGTPDVENPGVVLGHLLGVLGRHGRDKVTILASPGIAGFGAWLEQLLAESTGKNGKGLIPVDREPPGPPECYGQDRLFVFLRLDSSPDPEQDRAAAALEEAGQPVIRISVPDVGALPQEFFRWEFATAVAGSILRINPFDQPDVEASKVATRELTSAYEQTGSLPSESPFLKEGEIHLFADERNASEVLKGAGPRANLIGCLQAHLARLGPGDYFALLAYLHQSPQIEDQLQILRRVVRDRRQVATCLGFGPRFLHSTGQAYKGGPNSGVFLQVTCEDPLDLDVPGQRYTFGIVKAAQARGDFAVLLERNRRALRVHLTGEVESGLRGLVSAIKGS